MTVLRYSAAMLAVASLSGCLGSDDNPADCPETGAYACLSGETEPLYPFQWALNYAASFFKDYPQVFGGGMDLNVAPVHRQGIKGQGVNVLVLDSGTDLHNPDLLPNADFGMSWNFITQQHDPYPSGIKGSRDAHGTVVAGIIGAAQNGVGVMGIAPRATLGAANYLEGQAGIFAAYGGAEWSSKAHVINASYGNDLYAQPYEGDVALAQTTALRGLKRLREGKGAVFIKSAANSFQGDTCGYAPAFFDCTNPANDPAVLESNVVVVAALNAKGQASSYSSAGSVIWITGMGGEFGEEGNYGEDGSGPTIFGTDISGCVHGYSARNADTPFLRGETQRNGVADNPDCNYAYMNGTSAAAPTITGVTALMLSANPDLTWRDVRDILRMSARKIDADYPQRMPAGSDAVRFGARMSLSDNRMRTDMGSTADIFDGASLVPVNLGWQRNGAGYAHSEWYGFGVPDAQKAVALAQEYRRDPGRSRAGDVTIPAFQKVAYWQLQADDVPDIAKGAQVRIGAFPYQRVTLAGTFKVDAGIVDQFQVRFSGENVCLGSLGIAVKSPSGTVSLLKLPNDHFKADGTNAFDDYGLASVAFHGESTQGDWEIYTLAANPEIPATIWVDDDWQESEPCPITDDDGDDIAFRMLIEARVMTQ